MIAIYTPYHSARIKYVLDYLFREKFGLDYRLFDDELSIDESFKIRINYSDKPKEKFLNILPEGLLGEKGIQQREIAVSFVNEASGYIIFKNESDIGFDLFSAIFYCLSRYEEYQENNQDFHGRFYYQNAFQWKNKILQWPIVDFWIKDFSLHLSDRFGTQPPLNKKFGIIPTIDIDSVFTFKGRGLARQVGGFAKSLAQFKWDEFIKRFNVVFLGAKDPNDNFDYQFQALRQYELKATYFIQVGAYGPYDKNVNAGHSGFRNIIRNIQKEGHDIGLHPSYQSDGNYEIIKKEKETLEAIIEKAVTQSRQHYLRFTLPNTYRTLAALGIKEEYSMGYSEVIGYRAGTSETFYWYDLEREEATDLEIHPFCAMDVAFKEFLKLGISEVKIDIKEMKQLLQRVDGQFCFVYHNESLSDYRGWKGWREIFEACLSHEDTVY